MQKMLNELQNSVIKIEFILYNVQNFMFNILFHIN